ncbi:MAG: hypothetical protein AAGF50_05500, partial [Pseudomonadota bacterium]
NSGSGCLFLVFPAQAYAASSALVVNFDRSVFRTGATAYDIGASPTVTQIDSIPYNESGPAPSMSGAVAADDGIVAMQASSTNPAPDPTWAGVAKNWSLNRSGRRLTAASATGLSAGTVTPVCSWDLGEADEDSRTSGLLLRIEG